MSHRPTWTNPYRFIFAVDIHWGYQNESGRKTPLHNLPAVNAMLAFAKHFQPHGFILGGDQLDFGAISHHNAHRKVGVEGLRIQQDIDEFSSEVMVPLEEQGIEDLWWMMGNHEAWLDQLTDKESGLADTLTIPKLFNLDARGWTFIEQGGHLDLGKLRFVHGDVLGGSDAVAKAAILEHNHSIAFGHFHTTQSYTKHSPVDSTAIHIGVAVPALANRGPAYGKRRANKWATGFMYGYIHPDGTFNHYVVTITNGRFAAEGRVFGV